MTKWTSVKDGLPKGGIRCLVVHDKFYPYKPIDVFYDANDKCFIFGPHRHDMPSFVPLAVTHYIEIPGLEREE